MGHFLQKESWSFALLATSKRRGGGGCTLLIFKWQGCAVHLWFQKRQKLSLNLWGGGQGVVFSHSSSSFSLPRLLSPTHFLPSPPFFLLALSPVSLIFPHLSPTSLHSSTLSFLPPLSPFTLSPSSMWSWLLWIPYTHLCCSGVEI